MTESNELTAKAPYIRVPYIRAANGRLDEDNSRMFRGVCTLFEKLYEEHKNGTAIETLNRGELETTLDGYNELLEAIQASPSDVEQKIFEGLGADISRDEFDGFLEKLIAQRAQYAKEDRLDAGEPLHEPHV